MPYDATPDPVSAKPSSKYGICLTSIIRNEARLKRQLSKFQKIPAESSKEVNSFHPLQFQRTDKWETVDEEIEMRKHDQAIRDSEKKRIISQCYEFAFAVSTFYWLGFIGLLVTYIGSNLETARIVQEISFRMFVIPGVIVFLAVIYFTAIMISKLFK